MSLVGGMAAGSDSIDDLNDIDDMDRLRHGATGRLLSGVRAPSMPGSFQRSFTHGRVEQLHALARRFLHELARLTPLLPGREPGRLRGCAGDPRTPRAGRQRSPLRPSRTARACGASGLLVLRADAAYYGADVINACRALGARFSITTRTNASVEATIARIDEDAWTPITYPQAVWDEEGQRWISDAETAEIRCTAFPSKPKRQEVTARLIVRRGNRLSRYRPRRAGRALRHLAPPHRVHRLHSPLALRDAESDHRRHAVVEQMIADVKNSGFTHALSGHFQANAAWLALATLAHNLTRAADAPASVLHARATTATIRDRLISVPARPMPK
ncbi:hypothetical protein GPA10_24420 [Streptomyces sp. p1417]|uniref:Transposase DDE domain-containing protein n=1 Tax=Streptomyces typhae TaxID=2681492 RepID=A0A6L6X1U7_9ACTN|nr:transposase [Streptomyces typhae]MVO87818.1 hypothetical protein [Streptomyces typhae]